MPGIFILVCIVGIVFGYAGHKADKKLAMQQHGEQYTMKRSRASLAFYLWAAFVNLLFAVRFLAEQYRKNGMIRWFEGALSAIFVLFALCVLGYCIYGYVWRLEVTEMRVTSYTWLKKPKVYLTEELTYIRRVYRRYDTYYQVFCGPQKKLVIEKDAIGGKQFVERMLARGCGIPNNRIDNVDMESGMEMRVPVVAKEYRPLYVALWLMGVLMAGGATVIAWRDASVATLLTQVLMYGMLLALLVDGAGSKRWRIWAKRQELIIQKAFGKRHSYKYADITKAIVINSERGKWPGTHMALYGKGDNMAEKKLPQFMQEPMDIGN